MGNQANRVFYTTGSTASSVFDSGSVAVSGGNTKMNWSYAAGSYAAFPSTLTDGNRLVSNDDIALIAKIT